MGIEFNLYELIKKGGIINNICGNDVMSVYKDISNKISCPSYIDHQELYFELCSRETMISTAIGNGFSIPHPTHPLIKKASDQQVTLCYLENEIEMSAFDGKPVSVMFVILTENQNEHLAILQTLAKNLQNNDFKELLKRKPTLGEIEAFITGTNA
ncbi:MAG: PTS sugar transporter subunit IIA [Treponemataceae bacterium]|nr:PTS sugar transporter subunit IIA [Spirochaetales bacterium]MDY6031483.1 PTS sugar transporter subunit IIA [Treponemataceae bacterium]